MHILYFKGRIGQHASKCTAEQHSFGFYETDRNKRIQEEAKRNVESVQIGQMRLSEFYIAVLSSVLMKKKLKEFRAFI